MSGGARAIVVRHAVRTAQGMAQVVARADDKGNLKLTSLQDLKDYCYIVAGIVGELLTELFLHDTPSMRADSARVLQSNMVAFGEALQLVNILKDAGDDAKDGRVYLPASVPREEVLQLAREDLDRAAEYIGALQHGGAPRGYQAFTGVSVMLARGALKAIEERGSGAKVPRAFVSDVVARLEGALDSGAELRALMG
jgi:farnesyl-diphosphate farnesyltransferase